MDWCSNPNHRSDVYIDVSIATGRAEPPIPAGAGDIAGIAAGGGYVWLSHTDDTLTRIDINTGAARLTEPANALASFKAH